MKLAKRNFLIFFFFLFLYFCRESVMPSLQTCHQLLDYVSIHSLFCFVVDFYFYIGWYLIKFIYISSLLHADSSFVPALIYSVLGSSRHLGVGPVSIASLVMGSMLSESVSYSQDPILYLKLAFTATFFAGLFQSSLGVLRY
jgi:hypothetical protein